MLHHIGLKQVHLADEVRDETAVGILVELGRRRHLEHPASVHHRNPVRHGQRFALIVRDDDEGDADRVLQPHQLQAHGFPQLGVEGGQGLVEKQHLGFLHQRTRQRDALALAP